MLFPAVGFASESAQVLVAQSNAIEANSAQDETLYLNNDRVYAYNLISTHRQTINGITIPAGATIVGRYEPAKGGLRYVANAVVFGDRSYRIRAVSDVIEARSLLRSDFVLTTDQLQNLDCSPCTY